MTSKLFDDGFRFVPTPGLYLVATPIGNLRDVTLRALDVLGQADVIACEDTRVTQRLLQRYGIDVPVISYHDHNAQRVRPGIIRRLKSGEIVAVCSDAGTPLVSDPGYKLMTAAVAEGIAVHALPGPSSTLTALLLAGVPCERFLFLGFPPSKEKRRREYLAAFRDVDTALVLFEGASRLVATLKALAAELGDRPAAVTRELTKIYEEVRRGPLRALADHYTEQGAPKGEITIVVGPPGPNVEASEAEVDEQLSAALATLSVKDAVDLVAANSSWPRRRVYTRALDIKDSG